MLHRFGPFELDERRFELRRHGKPVAIQRKVLETIAFLVKNPDRLISKDELIEGPWKGTTVSDASLARVIMMARKTLTDRGRLGHLIQTVRGKGYRFLAEVTSSSTAGSSTTRTDSSSSTTSRSAADPIGNPTFLGRKQELEIMLAAAERAAGGHGNLLLVGGEPGIGKTSLLERFGRTVLGMEILWGRCWEGGGAPAFWPWLEIVRQYVDRHGDELILSMGSAASDIAR